MSTTNHPSPLDRLAELMSRNEILMGDLARNRGAIALAREYLESPGCNARFGEAQLERCWARHCAILAELRANRIEGLILLGDAGSGI